MGARDDEPTQVTRLRQDLRQSCAAERVELAAVSNAALDIGRVARGRPSSYPSLRLALTPPPDPEEDPDGDTDTDPEIELEELTPT